MCIYCSSEAHLHPYFFLLKVKKFMNALQRKADIQSRSVFSVQELREVSRTVGIQPADFMNYLSSMNIQGFILKKGPQLYRLLTVDY